MRRASLAFCLSLPVLLAGCGFGCAEIAGFGISSGTYVATQGPQALYPDPQITSKTMVVDRNAKTVTITYDQGGHHIQETWRIQ